MEALVNGIVAEGKQALDGKVNDALGIGFTVTGTVLTVLRHPLLVVTLRVTLYVPHVVNRWDGFACVEVFAAPLEGSPKFQLQAVIVPAPGVEVPLLKLTVVLSQTNGLKSNLAEALSSTVTIPDNVSTQPAVEVKLYKME